MIWTQSGPLPQQSFVGGRLVNLNNAIFILGGKAGAPFCDDCYSDKVYEYEHDSHR